MPHRCEPTCVFWRMCKYWQQRMISKCGMPLTRSMPSSLNMVCFHVLWSRVWRWKCWCQTEPVGFICGSFNLRLPPVRAAWRDSRWCVHVCVFVSLYVFGCGCVKYQNCDSLVSVDPLYLDMPTLFVSYTTLTHGHTPFLFHSALLFLHAWFSVPAWSWTL